MIEYGLSVSLNGSPRSPSRSPPRSPPRSLPLEYCLTPDCPRSSSFTPTTNNYRRGCHAAPRKIMKFADLSYSNDDYVSISPRALFPPLSDNVRRRLEPSFSDSMDELSPIPFTSTTTMKSVSIVPRGTTINVCDDNCDCSYCSVGECCVCYTHLPLRTNHVFTLCGHLFCVRCLLKWWDTSSTCPICRAELFEAAADAVDGEDTDDDGEDTDDDGEDTDEDGEDTDEDGEDTDEDTDEDEDDDGDASIVNVVHNTLINRYLNTGRFFERRQIFTHHLGGDGGGGESEYESDSESDGESDDYYRCEYDKSIRANIDDTIESYRETYGLSSFEIRKIRANRGIAMNLYARMLFREMLLSQTYNFCGNVRYGKSVIPKDQWNHLDYQSQSYLDKVPMYEFVTIRGCDISPMDETNLFGFIKEIQLVRVDRAEDDADADWENLHEYTFIADVFSPTRFQVKYSSAANGWPEAQYKLLGTYDMTEGTISPVQLNIPFSQIRRLYRIQGTERVGGVQC